jgi:hypothetical protein
MASQYRPNTRINSALTAVYGGQHIPNVLDSKTPAQMDNRVGILPLVMDLVFLVPPISVTANNNDKKTNKQNDNPKTRCIKREFGGRIEQSRAYVAFYVVVPAGQNRLK